MKNRSAVDTIKGYFYQFDYSILKLLELNNLNDEIIIENIEDIDISSLDDYIAIQCKYYESTEYNHSVVAPAVRYMLNDYYERTINKKDLINYKLYGFYKTGHEKLQLPLTLEYLKEKFLKFSKENKIHIYHEELGIKDNELNDFLSRLSLDIKANSFDEQFNKIINKTREIFQCSLFEAEIYYYNNALKCIKDLSIKKDNVDRVISKKDFLQIIDKKELLFDTWFSYFKTEKELYKKIKSEYFSSSFNVSPYERFFLIEVNPINYSRIDLKEIIYLISEKWANISKRNPTPFCPYIYIHNIDKDELICLKKNMYSERLIFIDGFSFYGSSFECNEILRKATYNNQLKMKFLNEIHHITQILELITAKKEIYQFFFERTFF